MLRGELWWTTLPEPTGSETGYRRPVVIVSSDNFNKSRINTIIVAAITSNLKWANAPANVQVGRTGAGLTRPSVINLTQVVTLDKSSLAKRIGRLSARQMQQVEEGLRLVLEV